MDIKFELVPNPDLLVVTSLSGSLGHWAPMLSKIRGVNSVECYEKYPSDGHSPYKLHIKVSKAVPLSEVEQQAKYLMGLTKDHPAPLTTNCFTLENVRNPSMVVFYSALPIRNIARTLKTLPGVEGVDAPACEPLRIQMTWDTTMQRRAPEISAVAKMIHDATGLDYVTPFQ